MFYQKCLEVCLSKALLLQVKVCHSEGCRISVISTRLCQHPEGLSGRKGVQSSPLSTAYGTSIFWHKNKDLRMKGLQPFPFPANGKLAPLGICLL